MPPKKKSQPNTAERHSLVQWIRAEFLKGGRKPENKLLRPGAGNYVKHERTFRQRGLRSGLVAAPHLAHSSVRLRVRHPSRRQERQVRKTLHPQVRWSRPRDYDNQYVLAGADLSQLMANTATAAKQLTEVRLINGKTSKGNSTPTQLFDLIHPADAPPTEEQVDAAIQWLFDRVLLRSPTREEQARFQTFAMQSMKSDGKLLGVRNLISAILLKARGSLPLRTRPRRARRT